MEMLKDFKYVEGVSGYGVTRCGRIYSHRYERWVAEGKRKRGYVFMNVLMDDGSMKRTSRHRMVAMAYHGMPPFDGAVVNHINGVPGDDRADNLGWVTHQENLHHAGAIGLTSKCLPVTVRNALTDELTHFPSAQLAAKWLRTSKDTLLWRLRQPENRVYSGWWQVRIRDDEREWARTKREHYGRNQAVEVKNIETSEVLRFNSQREAASAIEVSDGTISSNLSEGKQALIKDLYLIKYAHSTVAWRPTLTVLDEIQRTRPVVVRDPVTGIETTYKSAKDCADAHDLKVTTLNERLNCGKDKIHKDGLQYYRYNSLGPLSS